MIDAKSLLNVLMGAGQQASRQAGSTLQQGGPGGLAGQLFNMAKQGLGDMGQRADQATGASGRASEAVTRATGRQPADLMAQARDMLGKNQMATGAILGSLGGLLLGSKGGRGMVGDVAKLGALAAIGGLAYQAYRNHQAGKPILGAGNEAQPGAQSLPPPALPAPSGSGFEEDAVSNDNALLFIRAMIAAAASDGAIDETERGRIMAGVQQAGLDTEAVEWLDHEMAAPATVEELAAGARSPQVRAQLYTAARIAIDPDHKAERRFLANLAVELDLAPDLVAHIEASAAQAQAQG
jgi:uncharacterized membrane protein YebE (DUF533 family)